MMVSLWGWMISAYKQGRYSVCVHLVNMGATQSVVLQCWSRILEVSTRPGINLLRREKREKREREIEWLVFNSTSVRLQEYEPCLWGCVPIARSLSLYQHFLLLGLAQGGTFFHPFLGSFPGPWFQSLFHSTSPFHCLYSSSLFSFFSFYMNVTSFLIFSATDNHCSSIIVPSSSLDCLFKYYNYEKLGFICTKCNYATPKCIKAKIILFLNLHVHIHTAFP